MTATAEDDGVAARGDAMAAWDDPQSHLRRDARSILDAALRAVEPADLVRRSLREAPLDLPGPPHERGRLLVVAVGKAALSMARGAHDVLGDSVADTIVVHPRSAEESPPPGARTFPAGHPLPDEGGVAGSRAVRDALESAGADDRVLLLLSGGGSALLTLPAGEVSLADLRAVTDALLGSGADIREVNAVRKHLEVLKGGGLARVAAPAAVTALVLSDVVGDPLDVIASGPAAPDPSTWSDAAAVVDRLAEDDVPGAVRRRLERGLRGELPDTPGEGDPVFDTVETRIVGNAETAARAAAEEAGSLGYDATVESTTVTGEAREVGAELGRRLADATGPAALVWAGETTVTVTGSGSGGRNQEVALGAARELAGHGPRLHMSVGTDGVDGPTDAAGAWVTDRTVERAAREGLDPDDALDRNDAYPFFEALGDLVVTGPTGTNVMDLMVGLVPPPGHPAGPGESTPDRPGGPTRSPG